MSSGGVLETAVDLTCGPRRVEVMSGRLEGSFLSDAAEIADLAAHLVEGGTTVARQLTVTGADDGR